MDRYGYRSGGPSELVGRVQSVGRGGRWSDHNTRSPYRADLRRNDVVNAARHAPVQRHLRTGGDRRRVGGETRDGRGWAGGYVGVRKDRAHLHDLEAGRGDALQQIEIAVVPPA